MMSSKTEPIDQYISAFPKSTQVLLQQMRATIRKAAPEAEEAISYRMPAFKLNGNLVYFAGYNHHIGFYPGAAVMSLFKKDLMGYKSAKGSVQFPLDKPLPLELVTKIVKFRIRQNMEKAKAKAKKN